jgi:hypothetical protein
LAAESVLYRVTNTHILADKGFIGEAWQAEIYHNCGNAIWTQKRANQKKQNPPTFDRLLNSLCERIEGLFNSLQNTGRNLECLLAKLEGGLFTRLAAKITAFTYRQLLFHSFGIDVLTFSISH